MHVYVTTISIQTDNKQELLPDQVLNYTGGGLQPLPPGPFKGSLYHPPVKACRCSAVSADLGSSGVGFKVEQICDEEGAFEEACGPRGTDVVVLRYSQRVHPEEVVITAWLPDTCRLRVLARHPPHQSATHHPVSRNTSALRHVIAKASGASRSTVKPALSGPHGGGSTTRVAPSVHTVLTGCADVWEPLWDGVVLDIRDPAKPGQLRLPLPPPHMETDTLMVQVSTRNL